jgi:two-component system, NtrC family, response regulator AtoC
MFRTVLVIDDEQQVRWVLSKALERAGYTVLSAESGVEGLQILAHEPVDLVVLDLKLKGEDGLQVLRQIRERHPDVLTVILSAYGTVPGAVEAMRLGAVDVLRKPFDTEEVMGKLARALEQHALRSELEQLRQERRGHQTFDDLIGLSVAWQQTVVQAKSLAQLDDDVLLVGEAATGRTSLARAIHAASRRARAPLLELDLRTYRGEARLRALLGVDGVGGVWVQAGSGSLLLRGLDVALEVHAALAERLRLRPPGTGPRLLVVLDDDQQLPNELGTVVPAVLAVPPLRARASDVRLLALHAAQGRRITPQALRLLDAYSWPGNVAELYAVVVGSVLSADGQLIDVVHLPMLHEPLNHGAARAVSLPPEGISLVEVEQTLIREALARTNGNKSKAAALLQLPRHIFRHRLKQYGLDLDGSTTQDGKI